MSELPASLSFEGSDANVTVEGSTVAFSFDQHAGKLQALRSQFDDHPELMAFLGRSVGLPTDRDGIRGTLRRRGKYVRRNRDGRAVLSFGDPILDLLTNDQGELTVGRERLAFGSEDLRQASDRLGGMSNVDLKSYGQNLSPYDLARTAMAGEEFSVIEASAGAIALASITSRTFVRDGDTMRFRVFKRRRFGGYWSMGAEIETWGQNFDEALIESRYLDTFLQQTCAAVKVDSDHDSNDDYLSEYEWGWNSPQPLKVISMCSARWKGEDFGPMRLETGEHCFEI